MEHSGAEFDIEKAIAEVSGLALHGGIDGDPRKQRLIKGPKEFRDLRKQSREN